MMRSAGWGAILFLLAACDAAQNRPERTRTKKMEEEMSEEAKPYRTATFGLG